MQQQISEDFLLHEEISAELSTLGSLETNSLDKNLRDRILKDLVPRHLAAAKTQKRQRRLNLLLLVGAVALLIYPPPFVFDSYEAVFVDRPDSYFDDGSRQFIWSLTIAASAAISIALLLRALELPFLEDRLQRLNKAALAALSFVTLVVGFFLLVIAYEEQIYGAAGSRVALYVFAQAVLAAGFIIDVHLLREAFTMSRTARQE